jgi:hypothetical protein
MPRPISGDSAVFGNMYLRPRINTFERNGAAGFRLLGMFTGLGVSGVSAGAAFKTGVTEGRDAFSIAVAGVPSLAIANRREPLS